MTDISAEHPSFNHKIFIFTRDLRLEDNLALNQALLSSPDIPLYCLFQFRKIQIGNKNDYRSDNAIEFMLESLQDLYSQIKDVGGALTFLYESGSTPNSSLQHFIGVLQNKSPKQNGVVYMSRGFTPFEIKREQQLQKMLKEINWELCLVENHILVNDVRDMLSGSGNMYLPFKPFYDRVLDIGVPSPVSLPKKSNISNRVFKSGKNGVVSLKQIQLLLPRQRISPNRLVKGGRHEALLKLKEAKIKQKDYKKLRDSFSHQTSLLSAYHHFGCISARESFHALKHIPTLTRQIIWRDFAHHRMAAWKTTGWLSPTKIGDSIKWKRDIRLENAWKNGQTGVPIVDAAMRQLKLEGYIHNRGRMAVANFLIKNLAIDWRVGERHFAQWLTDYDWSVNFMNWIGIAALLPTDQALRTMNPFIQAKKFDKDLIYIRKYIPELKDADPDEIFSQDRTSSIGDYPAPIVDYVQSRNDYQKWAKKYLLKYHPGDES
jgi:deoxyribodipyrimidine photo-lyase